MAEYAETSARDDEFSICPIYSEGRLAQDNVAAEKNVVEALVTLLDDNPLSLEIEKVLGRDALVGLLRIAIKRFKSKALKCRRIDLANAIAKTVRESLTIESRRPACPESPLLETAKRSAFVKRLAGLRALTRNEATISDKAIGKFRRITKRVPYFLKGDGFHCHAQQRAGCFHKAGWHRVYRCRQRDTPDLHLRFQ